MDGAIRDQADVVSIRVRRELHPDAQGPAPRRDPFRRFVLLSLAGLLLLGAPLTSIGLAVREQQVEAGRSSAERRSISELQARVLSLEAQIGAQPDWSAIAAAVQSSIFTVATDHGLGSVLDRHGRVVAVAAAKFAGQGVEALSLAIPVQTVCTTIVSCA